MDQITLCRKNQIKKHELNKIKNDFYFAVNISTLTINKILRKTHKIIRGHK